MSATLIDYKSSDETYKFRVVGRNYCGYLVQADGEEAALLDAYVPVTPLRPLVVPLGDGFYAVSLKYMRILGLA